MHDTAPEAVTLVKSGGISFVSSVLLYLQEAGIF